jgi:hypothetical protein
MNYSIQIEIFRSIHNNSIFASSLHHVESHSTTLKRQVSFFVYNEGFTIVVIGTETTAIEQASATAAIEHCRVYLSRQSSQRHLHRHFICF